MIKDSVIHLNDVDSTNSYIRRQLADKVPPYNLIVYTDFQHTGRGQRGNSWESERAKNLTFSTVAHFNQLKATDQFIISQAVSLSLLKVLSRRVSDITIKWPNDIYWKNKKIAGILIENDLIDDLIFRSIIGIGLNLNQEVFISNAPNPISLKQITGQSYPIRDFLDETITAITDYLQSIEQNALNIRKQYEAFLFRKEGYHKYRDSDGIFEACFQHVENSGILTLQMRNGQIRKYTFKEVSYIL